MFKVVYRIRESGVTVERAFDSPYQCKLLVNKLKRSKKCELVSFPIFD